jgi:hypothetical protein
MDLTQTIKSAEIQYKQILEEFFMSVYNENKLSSHGIDHHRRVWNYSREFLKLIPFKDNEQMLQLTANLIIACYMHDIGMSVDHGIKHGKLSRDLCIQFLKRNNLQEKNYLDALEAIEFHDNKDYSGKVSMNELLTILSVADDLDAFGLTGVFRYIEINLAREIELDRIGYMIRENAQKRYDNFIKTFGSVDELVVKHWERYYILDMFFSKYNEQLPTYHFGTNLPTGFCGVVEIIKFIMNNNLQLKDFYTEPERYTKDPLIKWFLVELEKEISGI